MATPISFRLVVPDEVFADLKDRRTARPGDPGVLPAAASIETTHRLLVASGSSRGAG